MSSVNFTSMPPSKEICSICQESVTDPVGHAASASANHIFCRTCIAGWFARTPHPDCPNCRAIVINPQDYAPQQATNQALADAGDATDSAPIAFVDGDGDIRLSGQNSIQMYIASGILLGIAAVGYFAATFFNKPNNF
jgi:hypothetical protein